MFEKHLWKSHIVSKDTGHLHKWDIDQNWVNMSIVTSYFTELWNLTFQILHLVFTEIMEHQLTQVLRILDMACK